MVNFISILTLRLSEGLLCNKPCCFIAQTWYRLDLGFNIASPSWFLFHSIKLVAINAFGSMVGDLITIIDSVIVPTRICYFLILTAISHVTTLFVDHIISWITPLRFRISLYTRAKHNGALGSNFQFIVENEKIYSACLRSCSSCFDFPVLTDKLTLRYPLDALKRFILIQIISELQDCFGVIQVFIYQFTLIIV